MQPKLKRGDRIRLPAGSEIQWCPRPHSTRGYKVYQGYYSDEINREDRQIGGYTIRPMYAYISRFFGDYQHNGNPTVELQDSNGFVFDAHYTDLELIADE